MCTPRSDASAPTSKGRGPGAGPSSGPADFKQPPYTPGGYIKLLSRQQFLLIKGLRRALRSAVEILTYQASATARRRGGNRFDQMCFPFTHLHKEGLYKTFSSVFRPHWGKPFFHTFDYSSSIRYSITMNDQFYQLDGIQSENKYSLIPLTHIFVCQKNALIMLNLVYETVLGSHSYNLLTIERGSDNYQDYPGDA